MSAFDLGYGTNGFSDHRLPDALRVIADLGYTAIGLTLDHCHLDPFAPGLVRRTDGLAALLAASGLRCAVETGARYLLDPFRKHHPTLVSESARPRTDFLLRAVRVAEALGATCVSFWSGVGEPGVSGRTNRDRIAAHLDPVLAEAGRRGVRLALEPEPGMAVQRLGEALALRRFLGAPEPLGVTLDVGHCVAVEPVDAAQCVRRAGGLLFNVQLDDMLPGVHEHLEFGQGALDLPGTLAALDESGYRGVAAVELPRHSHAAPRTAAKALAALHAARRVPSGRAASPGGTPAPAVRGDS
ncbi:sugar phosphate isomerase/epimerase family protein [Streptomyces sp. NPDC046985]|uniref:sugar phosphate isomerase/epimerase family protein n=1 Tax=Streptomyces sp. NPDC046985 TaxID=3155377 RepID=UPI0033FA3761